MLKVVSRGADQDGRVDQVRWEILLRQLLRLRIVLLRLLDEEELDDAKARAKMQSRFHVVFIDKASVFEEERCQVGAI